MTDQLEKQISEMMNKLGEIATANDTKEIKERLDQAKKDQVSSNERVQYLEKKIEELEKTNGKLETMVANYGTNNSNSKNTVDIGEYKDAYHRFLTNDAASKLEIRGEEALKNIKAFVDVKFPNYSNAQKEMTVKKLHEDSVAAGGNLVPADVLAEVFLTQADFINPVRQYARIINTTSNQVEMNVRDRITGATWSKAAPTASTSAPFKTIKIDVHDLVAKFSVTENLAMDSTSNIESIILEDALIDHNTTEAYAFLLGNGVGQPNGILNNTTYSATAISSFTYGQLGYYETATASTIAVTDLVYLRNRLPVQFRMGGMFVMNSETLSIVELLKDDADQYLLRHELLKEGTAGRILGYPVVIMEDMPAATDGLYPIMFANIRQLYTIVDRLGMYTMRDPYTSWPDVIWNTKKRVGGQVTNFHAARLLKIKAA